MSDADYAWATDPAAVAQAMADRDLGKPIAMLNLIRFRDRAAYEPESGEAPCSGEEAYARYVTHVSPILESLGAKITLSGYCWMLGDAAAWDRAFVVHYKSTADLLSIPAREDYQRIHHHRTAAIAETHLLMLDYDDTGFR